MIFMGLASLAAHRFPVFLSGWLLLVLSLLRPDPLQGADLRFGVFYPHYETVRIIRRAVEADPVFARLDVEIFSQYREFSRAGKGEAFQVILVPSFIPACSAEYRPAWQFLKGGKEQFRYLLVGLGDPPVPGKGSVAMPDLTGRQETRALFDRIDGKHSFRNSKVVAKARDLLPMLAMDNADFIYIAPGNLEYFARQYRLKPRIMGKTSPVGYPLICIKRDLRAGQPPDFRLLKPETLKALGFTGIKQVVKKR